MRLIETPRLVISIDAESLSDETIDFIARKIEPHLDQVYLAYATINDEVMAIFKEQNIAGKVFEE